MVVNTARIRLRPENRKEFFQTIRGLIESIQRAKGCLGFHFYIDSADADCSLLVGEWETESDLENHLRSNDFAILRGAISVLCTQRDEYRALIDSGDREKVRPRTGITTVL